MIPARIQVFRPNDATAQIGQGFTILKDRDAKKPNGFLTVPSKVITGIDDPQVNFFSAKPVLPLPLSASLLSSSYSRNYWAQAWAALDYTVNKMYQLDPTRVHPGTALGPGQMGLAVNSIAGRTSNQLHIHMSCINRAVREALTSNMAMITITKWTKIQIPVSPTFKRSYSVILLPDLSQNPFLVMYTEGPIVPGDETLVVTGMPGTTNYYLLEDYSHSSDIGEGEELLDQTCASWP
jgi:CDP-diacylglycerol pyrophosphatase